VSDNLAERDTETDLKAAIAARRDLGPDTEDHVVESFLARVEQRIDLRVDRRLAETRAKEGAPPRQRKQEKLEDVLAVPLGISIPVFAIAAIFARTTGILIVMAGVVIIITLICIDRWR